MPRRTGVPSPASISDKAFDAKLGGLEAKLDGFKGEVNARFDAIGVKIDVLDRDVQALTRRAFEADGK